MPDLVSLSAELGEHLQPYAGAAVPALDVTGVHVSELTDPTPFLDGGELLLTTGMPLTGRTIPARAYVARLTHRGVAALGIGLGPVHERVPAELAAACADEGLPLLVVPAATGFLVVARAYWGLLARSGEERLSAALGAHQSLVRAAAGDDPGCAVVRILAGAVDGWAALLSRGGGVIDVWPRQSRVAAEQAAGEVTRLRVAGPHSSATFPVGGNDVVLHPLAIRGRLTGFLATGCRPPMSRSHRQTVLTAAALLTRQEEQRYQRDAGPRSLRAAAARLLLSGELSAARLIQADLGARPLGPEVRLLLVDTAAPVSEEVLTDGLEPLLSSDRPGLILPRRSGARVILDGDGEAPDLDLLRRWLAELAPRGRALLSTPLGLDQLHRADTALRQPLRQLRPGAVRTIGDDSPGALASGIDLGPLLRYRRSDLTPAVAAYLRARGHWEEAARELGVHRNTLRHRIGTAAKVLAVDLDDPDVAARLWLALRGEGLA